jgi:integrase/recombinase XerC
VRSVETYGECLRVFGRWLEESGIRDLRRVSASQLVGFQIWMSRERRRGGGGFFSPSYRAKHVAVVRGLYRFLEAEGRVFGNPAARLRYPKVPRRIGRNALDASGLKALLSCPENGDRGLRDAVAVRILALSGLRVGELTALKLADVNVGEREILVRGGKGGKDRATFFDVRTQEKIGRYLQRARPRLAGADEPWFLVGDSGGRMWPHQVRALLRERAGRLGLTVTPHGLRHTFCTQLLLHGANLKVIAELAGHSRLSTTARYTRVDIRDLTRVYRRAHPRCGR